jgi:hypothetical protein
MMKRVGTKLQRDGTRAEGGDDETWWCESGHLHRRVGNIFLTCLDQGATIPFLASDNTNGFTLTTSAKKLKFVIAKNLHYSGITSKPARLPLMTLHHCHHY